MKSIAFGTKGIYISNTQPVLPNRSFAYIMPHPTETGIFTCIPDWENKPDDDPIEITLNPGDAPFYGGCKTVVVSSGAVIGVE